MADGLISIRSRKTDETVTPAQLRRQQKKASYKYALKQHVPNKVTGLSATFRVGGALARAGGEIDSFSMGLLIKILKNVKK